MSLIDGNIAHVYFMYVASYCLPGWSISSSKLSSQTTVVFVGRADQIDIFDVAISAIEVEHFRARTSHHSRYFSKIKLRINPLSGKNSSSSSPSSTWNVIIPCGLRPSNQPLLQDGDLELQRKLTTAIAATPTCSLTRISALYSSFVKITH